MISLELNDKEMIVLYKYLKKREEEIPTQLLMILKRLEEKLYDNLTIEEIEALESS